MPDKLQELLTNCKTDEAINIWEWLDENPNALDEMIAMVCNSHGL